jgi:hypothetical protein
MVCKGHNDVCMTLLHQGKAEKMQHWNAVNTTSGPPLLTYVSSDNALK